MEFSQAYPFVRARQLEGTFPGDPRDGTWGITYNRIFFGWGRVPESAFPYKRLGKTESDFAQSEPTGIDLDRMAKAHRIRHYQRVRNLRECRKILSRNQRAFAKFMAIVRSGRRPSTISIPGYLEMKGAFEITQQFVEASQGIILLPPPDAPVIGSHGVPFLEDLKAQKMLEFPNSWGVGWGNNGIGYMPYEFFDKWLVEAWAIDESDAILPMGAGIQLLPREEADPLGGRLYSVEVYDADADERIGWSFAVERDGNLDLEELFVRPQYRRKGYAGRLVDAMKERARQLDLPVRAWIPFADREPANLEALGALVARLGLTVQRSGVSWAAYKAIPGETGRVYFPIIRIPHRPAYAAESERGESYEWNTLRGSVLKYEDPFEPAVAPEDWEVS